MSYLEMIRELADSPTMDDGQAREWLRRMIDEKRRKAWSPAATTGGKVYRLKPGCCAAANNYGDKTFPPEIGPTFTVDWSFSGPLGDVSCYRAVDASGRKGYVFYDEVEEVH